MKLGTPAPATPAAELARLQWTVAIVAGATLPHWPTLPFWVPLLLGVAIAWRLAIAALEWPVPIRTLRLLLALAAFLRRACSRIARSTASRPAARCWS